MFKEKGTVFAKALRWERAGLVPGTERTRDFKLCGRRTERNEMSLERLAKATSCMAL